MKSNWLGAKSDKVHPPKRHLPGILKPAEREKMGEWEGETHKNNREYERRGVRQTTTKKAREAKRGGGEG